MNGIHQNVSVIILTYNGSAYIENLLLSLDNQSYPKECFEIIVVDNASTDNTLDVVSKRFAGVKQVPLEKNLGYGGGNNEGLRHARNDILAFLNQDTICHRNWLSELVMPFSFDERIAACSSNIIPSKYNEVAELKQKYPLDYIYFCDLSPYGYGRFRTVRNKKYLFSNFVSGCAFAIRRDILNNMGYLFDERLWMYAEDTDLSLRILNMGKCICVAKDSVVCHLHDNEIEISRFAMSLSFQAIMNRIYAFYKNMSGIEFFLYFPFLLLGGIFKVTEFPLKPSKKVFYFIPFGMFSAAAMLKAIWHMTDFRHKKKNVMNKRAINNFSIYKFLF